MLLRRDLRTLLGLAAGFALQALAVAVLLGPGVWLDYLHALPGDFRRYPRLSLFAAVRAVVCGHRQQSAVGGRAHGMGSAGDEDRLRGHGQRGRGHALPRRLGGGGSGDAAGASQQG